MDRCDVLVIGAGLLGCFTARALSQYELKITVLEAGEDVCKGISRANTGIIYTGCDTKPHTLKTDLCVKANKDFTELCSELDVPFKRCGSLMIALGGSAENVIRKKYRNGLENQVEDIFLLSGSEVRDLEPALTKEVTLGLYAKGTGTVDPWALGIAAYENASANGACFCFNQKAVKIEKTTEGFIVSTEDKSYLAKAIVNCAGLASDSVRELLYKPSVRIFPSAADYYVLDTKADGFIKHVIFHEPEEKGKGLTLVPTVDGNILIGPTERDRTGDGKCATTIDGLSFLKSLCGQIVPDLDLNQIIRNFGSERPNPYYVNYIDGEYKPEDKSISNFTIFEEDGIFSLIGIKTPGLTCSWELGKYVTGKVLSYLSEIANAKDIDCCSNGLIVKKSDFDPCRKGIPHVNSLGFEERNALIKSNPAYGRVICRCKHVTEGEVREAIRRGASTIDGVKRRVVAGMGRCQGGYCMQRILEILSESKGIDINKITKDGFGSEILNSSYPLGTDVTCSEVLK